MYDQLARQPRRGSSACMDHISEPPGIPCTCAGREFRASSALEAGALSSDPFSPAEASEPGMAHHPGRCTATLAGVRVVRPLRASCGATSMPFPGRPGGFPPDPEACREKRTTNLACAARTRASVPIPRNLQPFDPTDCVKNAQSASNSYLQPSVVNVPSCTKLRPYLQRSGEASHRPLLPTAATPPLTKMHNPCQLMHPT